LDVSGRIAYYSGMRAKQTNPNPEKKETRMGTLEALLSVGASLRVVSFDSPRGLGRSWFIETDDGEAVEVFGTEEDARAALRGERKPAERLVSFA